MYVPYMDTFWWNLERFKSRSQEKKRLEKSTKQMEKERCIWPWHSRFWLLNLLALNQLIWRFHGWTKDIKSLDSSREDRIKYFERQIAELKKSAKQNVDKIEKQREKTEQAQVEVEVLRNELLQMEGKEQDWTEQTNSSGKNQAKQTNNYHFGDLI